MVLQFVQRNGSVERDAVVENMKIAFLEIDNFIALRIFDVGVC